MNNQNAFNYISNTSFSPGMELVIPGYGKLKNIYFDYKIIKPGNDKAVEIKLKITFLELLIDRGNTVPSELGDTHIVPIRLDQSKTTFHLHQQFFKSNERMVKSISLVEVDKRLPEFEIEIRFNLV